MAKKELSTGAIVGIALGSTLLLAGGTYLIVKAVNKSGSSGSNKTVTLPSNTGGGGGSSSSSDKKGGFWNEAGVWIDRGLEIFDRFNKDKTEPAEGKVNTGGDDDGVKVVLRNGVFMPSDL